MALLKNGRLTDDTYTDVSASNEIPATGAVLVSLEQWREHRDALLMHSGKLGVRLASDQKPALIADDLEHFDLVALEFPAFTDGRAYSYARLLRDRYGYTGEVRAVGDVLLEQLNFMQRVGFDAFSIADDGTAEAWEVAAAEISVWYQPTNDGREPAVELRHKAA